MSPAIEYHQPAEARIDCWKLLRCISPVESNDNDFVIGRMGEVSRYQILPLNWRAMTDEPISRASDPKISKEVARRWLDGIIYDLQTDRLEVTPENIVWMWHRGRSGVINKSFMSKASRDHVQRVLNLYYER